MNNENTIKQELVKKEKTLRGGVPINKATKQAKRAKYDGRSSMPEYKIWKGMISRCNCPTNSGYYKYGGRGIKVCSRWQGIDGFYNFIKDMGTRKQDESIDRIDVDGNYEPSNCRWADNTTQANNKRSTIYITAFGKTQSLQQWSDETGINRKTILWRIKKGWATNIALTEIHERGYNGSK